MVGRSALFLIMGGARGCNLPPNFAWPLNCFSKRFLVTSRHFFGIICSSFTANFSQKQFLIMLNFLLRRLIVWSQVVEINSLWCASVARIYVWRQNSYHTAVWKQVNLSLWKQKITGKQSEKSQILSKKHAKRNNVLIFLSLINKINFNSLLAVIHKHKRNATGNNEKVVQPWYRQSKCLDTSVCWSSDVGNFLISKRFS